MSIFDHPDAVPTPPSWRCPHCRTLQPETTRCWACSRSTINCATCHRFRSSVASDLGYCADDAARTPLSGDEVRDCWAATEESYVDAPGLFSDLATPAPALPEPVLPASPPPAVVRTASSASRDGGLVEAPQVKPGRTVMSEVRRRSQRGRAS